MISIQHQQIFEQTVTQAISLSAQKLSGKRLESIVKQIARAVYEAETNPFLQFDRETESLSIFSRSSLNTYIVIEGGCFRADGNLCPAKTHCYHRILRRLIARYHENCRLSTLTVDLKKTYSVMPKTKQQKSEIKPQHQIRRVLKTDKQGREYYVEMVGSLIVSNRTYTKKQPAGAK